MDTPPNRDFESASQRECLIAAVRLALTPSHASLQPDLESVDGALARFKPLGYSGKLDLIATASRAVCLALWQDLTAAKPKTIEV